jgi:hypothetical protein
MFRNRRSPSDVLAEWRLPREERQAARKARKLEKQQASAERRAAGLDAESKRNSPWGGPGGM